MNIIITGVSRGIGYELVKYFARIENTNIYAVSRDEKALTELVSENKTLKNHSKVYPINYDIGQIFSNPDSLNELLPADLQHIDILINNAGKLINKPFIAFQPDEIETIFQINCFAPALLIRQLLPMMGKTGNTHVINISSMGGFQGSRKFSGLSWYSASKSALACLTECLEEEINHKNIAFNCLALGAVQTEMLREAFPGYKAPVKAQEMADFIGHFALTANKFLRGKIIPVSLTTP
jgi:short-subunit dehydrogenase